MPNLKLKEPKTPKYIFIDENNKVRLMLPVIGGASIGTDNTCKSALAPQAFFGLSNSSHAPQSAASSLQSYKSALEYDLAVMPPGPEKDLKADRLKQINQYLKVMQQLAEDQRIKGPLKLGNMPEYPEAVQEKINARSNSYSMLLDVQKPDDATRLGNYICSFRRRCWQHEDEHGNDGYVRGFYPGFGEVLRKKFLEQPKLEINQPDAKKAVLKSILNNKIFKGIDPNAVSEQWVREHLDEIKAEMTKSIKAVLDDEAVSPDYQMYNMPIDMDFLTDTMCFFDPSGPATKLEEVVDTLLNGSGIADEVWSQKTSPFKVNVENDKFSEQLAVATQFFIAQANIYAYANGLTTADFGKVLETGGNLEQLRVGMAETVRKALTDGNSVEDEILKFINQNKEHFGLQQELSEQHQADILREFGKNFTTINGSPHYDEFLVMDNSKTGNMFQHQGAMCIDFSTIMDKFPELDNEFFQDMRASSGQLNQNVRALSNNNEDKVSEDLELTKYQLDEVHKNLTNSCLDVCISLNKQFISGLNTEIQSTLFNEIVKMLSIHLTIQCLPYFLLFH